MKKGFTLIELLAVIVILAIILVISVPIVTGIIDGIKEKSAISNGQMLYKAGQLTYTSNLVKGLDEDVTFTLAGGKANSSNPNSKLEFNNGENLVGFVRVKSNGSVFINIYDGDFCVRKDYLSDEFLLNEMSEEDCLSSLENPEISLVGIKHLKVPINSAYVELGYDAYDVADGDLSADVQVAGAIDFTRAGNYTLTYTVTDSEGNVGTANRTVEVVDIFNTMIGRYVILETNSHYGSNCASINEVDVLASDDSSLSYTPITSYDSDTGTLPYYWNDSIWTKTGLYDNGLEYSISNSMLLICDNIPNSDSWNRTVLDLGSSREIQRVNVHAGADDHRIPHNVKVYVADSYDYDTNIAGRSDNGLEQIGIADFESDDYQTILKNVSANNNSLELIKETEDVKSGSLKIFVNAIMEDEIQEIKWTFGEKSIKYFESSGDLITNGHSIIANKNGTYTVYAQAINGYKIKEQIVVNNIDEGPEITLNGNEIERVSLNENYIELGATAFDVVDDEIKTVEITGSVNTSVVGDYNIIYSAIDSNGSVMTKTRIVKVRDSSYDFSPYGTVYYVSADGNDTTGDGTESTPFSTLAKAYNEASSGDAIYIHGNTTLSSPINLTKNIDIYGSYLEHDSKITMTTYRLFKTSKDRTTKFYGIYLDGSGIYEIFDGYQGSYTNKGNVEIHNCVVENTDSSRNVFIHLQSMKMYNSLLIANITFNSATYTANAEYVNLAVTGANLYPGNNSSITTSLTSVTYNPLTFNLTSTGWLDSGTGIDRDGSQSNIGLYGGIYSW